MGRSLQRHDSARARHRVHSPAALVLSLVLAFRFKRARRRALAGIVSFARQSRSRQAWSRHTTSGRDRAARSPAHLSSAAMAQFLKVVGSDAKEPIAIGVVENDGEALDFARQIAGHAGSGWVECHDWSRAIGFVEARCRAAGKKPNGSTSDRASHEGGIQRDRCCGAAHRDEVLARARDGPDGFSQTMSLQHTTQLAVQRSAALATFLVPTWKARKESLLAGSRSRLSCRASASLDRI